MTSGAWSLPHASAEVGRTAGLLRSTVRWLAPALAFALLVLLVYRYDAPLVLAAAVGLAGGVFMLLRPELATLAVLFLLYTNIPVVAYKLHGVPQPVAGAFLLLLFLPLGRFLIVRRERARTDGAFHLMLVLLAVYLVASLSARDLGVATQSVLTYVVEGVVLYWLILNVVRDFPTLRRVVWTVLAAGGLLGGLSVYQELTGNFHQQFGGLAQRNSEFMDLRQQLEANPDDPALREMLALYPKDGRSRRAEGPMDEPNTYAQIMLVLLPLALFSYRNGITARSRLLAVLAGALIMGGIIVSYSRGALLALVLLLAIAGYLRWIRRDRLVIGALAVACVVPLVASDYFVKRLSAMAAAVEIVQGRSSADDDVAIRGRATSMLAAFQVFLDHPVIGVGPGQYAPFYSREYHQRDPRIKFKDIRGTRRAHSLYLEMAAQVGIVGLSVFLSIVYLLIRQLARARSRLATELPEMADLLTALLLSIAAFLLTGIFLHLAYERYFWAVLGIAGAALQVARGAERASPAQTGLTC